MTVAEQTKEFQFMMDDLFTTYAENSEVATDLCNWMMDNCCDYEECKNFLEGCAYHIVEGGCPYLIYYSETWKAFDLYYEEIQECIENGEIDMQYLTGDMKNWLTWCICEMKSREILEYIEWAYN